MHGQFHYGTLQHVLRKTLAHRRCVIACLVSIACVGQELQTVRLTLTFLYEEKRKKKKEFLVMSS